VINLHLTNLNNLAINFWVVLSTNSIERVHNLIHSIEFFHARQAPLIDLKALFLKFLYVVVVSTEIICQ